MGSSRTVQGHGWLLVLAVVVTSSTCSTTPPFRRCPDAPMDGLPARLSETGLDDPGVRAFQPRHGLWSDGAQKRRFIALPAGGVIDTSDPDEWSFPVGTRLWKEFSRDGVRVETRFLWRVTDGWRAAAYVWRGDDAYLAVDGVKNAVGTPHDVPSAAQCMGCHGGRRSFVLGFSAVQLPARGAPGELGLLDASDAGFFDRAPAPVTIPGDPTTRDALGYLHANCAHCHNQRRPVRTGPRCFDPERDFSLALHVGELGSPEATATYRTAVGELFIPGDPEDSPALVRARSRNPWWGMPALGTEDVDEHGVQLLERWVQGLPVQ